MSRRSNSFLVLAAVASAWTAPTGIARAQAKAPLEIYEVEGTQDSSFFGRVEWIGDLDSDGYDDFAVGVDRLDVSGNADVGAVYFYSGKTGTALLNADSNPVVLYGETANDSFGFAVTRIPDLDGDGVDEVAITAPSYYDDGGTSQQYVRIYSGGTLRNGAANPPRFCRISSPSTQGTAGNFGSDVQSAGFVTNSTKRDLLISSATGYDEVYLYAGTDVATHLAAGTNVTEAPVFELYDPASTSNPPPTVLADNLAISSYGDVNGDGFDDFLVGEYYIGHGATTTLGRGRIQLISGNGGTSSPLGTVLATMNGPTARSCFGYEFRPIVVGGTLQVAASASACDRAGASTTTPGKVLIVSVAGTPPTTYSFTTLATVTGDIGQFFGASLGSGDMDGDGKAELAVAARRYSEDMDHIGPRGRVLVYSLDDSGSSLVVDEMFSIDGHNPGDRLGRVTLDGDITNDGFAELLVGTGHVDDSPKVDVGAAYVVTWNYPATSELFGTNPIAGENGSPPSLSINTAPTLGTSCQISIGNTTLDGTVPDAALATLWVGTARDPNDSHTILVENYVSFPFNFSHGEATHVIANGVQFDPALIGVHQYLQAFVDDSAAAGGVAISKGLDLTLGSGAW